WGFHPWSEATTNRPRRPGPTPASMFSTNRSWRGTSTNPIWRLLGSVHHAYPRSIVSPRRFSSAQRSGSIPVIRMMSDDLPWSTCPAVATTRSSPLTSTFVVEVVALQGVEDRAGEIVQLLVRNRADVEHDVAVLDPAE